MIPTTDDHAIDTLVAAYVAAAGLDLTDSAALRGQCETVAYQLSRLLAASGLRCSPVQIWTDRVPSDLADDPMAAGHWVVVVASTDGDQYQIDITAAQFAGRSASAEPVFGFHL